MVNRGDLRGRRIHNVQEVRAIFVDLDTAPLAPAMSLSVQPSAVVETSPDKYHAYWRVKGIPLADFKRVQKALAAKLAGDSSVCDLPRVMRLPGYFHQKHEPFRSKLLHCECTAPMPWLELVDALGIGDSLDGKGGKYEMPQFIAEGNRNNTLFKCACGLRDRGLPISEGINRLCVVNAKCCKPPLPSSEVEALAASAWSSSARGFFKLPNRLYDDPEYIRLSGTQQKVLHHAYRVVNFQGNGKITLSERDLGGRVSRSSLKKARQALLDTPFLKLTKPAVTGIDGDEREPARYELTYTV